MTAIPPDVAQAPSPAFVARATKESDIGRTSAVTDPAIFIIP